MISAPAAPITARHAISSHIDVDIDASAAPTRNSEQPELQRALATEAIAERAGGEQQPGEHERVAGHDPLELRLGGVQLLRERRDRDVEARVADEDDQQAEAQHRERPPAPVVQGRVADDRRIRGHHGIRRFRPGRARTELVQDKWKHASVFGYYTERGFRLPTDKADALRRPPQPGTGAGRGRRRVLRDGPAGADRGGRARAPAWASARSAGTSRPSRRSWRRCSKRCTSRCSATPAGRWSSPIPASRSTRSSSRCRSSRRATAPWPSTWPPRSTCPVSAQPVRDALRGAIERAGHARAGRGRDSRRHRPRRRRAAVLRRRARDRARGRSPTRAAQALRRRSSSTGCAHSRRVTCRAGRSTSRSSSGSRSPRRNDRRASTRRSTRGAGSPSRS